MTIFTEVRTGSSFLEDIQAPLGDVLGAQAEEAWVRSPVPSIGRMLELRGANQGLPVGVGSDTGEIEMAPPSALVSAEDARTRIKNEGLALTVPDTGISRDALDILIKRKSEEKRRKDIIARGPSGIGPALAGFGVALGVSALDPLNVASAFIPVVSGARYGGMIAQAGGALGRVGVRARVGALEGAVGAAVVEPLVLGAAYQEQADYHLSDTLLNIALGGALGGGLHVGIGAASDALARRAAWQQARATDPLPRLLEEVSPETREAALRVGIAQAVSGRAIDVEPVIRAYHGSPHDFERFDISRIGTGEGAQAYGHGLYFAESEGVARTYADTLGARRMHAPPGVAEIKREDGMWNVYIDGQLENAFGSRADAETYVKPGRMYEVAIRADKDKFLDWDKPLSEQSEAIKAAVRAAYEKLAPQHHALGRLAFDETKPGSQILSELETNVDRAAVSAALRDAGIPGIKYLDAGSRNIDDEIASLEAALTNPPKPAPGSRIVYDEAKFIADTQAKIDALKQGGSRNFVLFDDKLVNITAKDGQPIRQEDFSAASAKSFDPAEGRMVDMDAVRVGDEKIKSAPANDDAAAIQESLADITQDVQALARALGDDELVARELKPFDDLADSADAYGKAVMAAANCGLRRGSA